MRFLLVPVAALATGCGTLHNVTDSANVKPFGGVSRSLKLARGEAYMGGLSWPIGVADTPLSAAGDVVTLPVTVPLAAKRAADGGAFAPPTPDWPRK